MHTPFVLLKFLAKALGKSLCAANEAGIAVLIAVDFIVDVLPEACKETWEWWKKERSAEERKADLEALAQAGIKEVKQGIAEIVLDVAADKPQEVQEMITLLLTQVPSLVRKSLRRASEPTGRTVAPDREPKESQDLLSFLPSKPPRFKSGYRFGDWELVELLGIGGFGEVWKARNPHMTSKSPVALKFCLDSISASVLRNEAAILDRVMREGKHPGIVELLHTYLNDATPCLEYEFIEGGDLAGMIHAWHRSEEKIRPDQIAKAVLQMAEIVGFAHKLNPPIVHRDLKPANVLVKQSSDGATSFKIADFGIGGIAANQLLRESARGTTQGRFLVSAVRGAYSPLYASPQQMKGDQPDPRDDVHALGVIWYQMLTNSLEKRTPSGDKYKRRLTDLGMTTGMIELLVSCFEEEPDDRPDDAADLAQAIRKQLSEGQGEKGPGPQNPPSPPAEVVGNSGWSEIVTLIGISPFNINRKKKDSNFNGWLTEKICKEYALIIEVVELDGHPNFRFVPSIDKEGHRGGFVMHVPDRYQQSQWEKIQKDKIGGLASGSKPLKLQIRYRVEPL